MSRKLHDMQTRETSTVCVSHALRRTEAECCSFCLQTRVAAGISLLERPTRAADERPAGAVLRAGLARLLLLRQLRLMLLLLRVHADERTERRVK